MKCQRHYARAVFDVCELAVTRGIYGRAVRVVEAAPCSRVLLPVQCSAIYLPPPATTDWRLVGWSSCFPLCVGINCLKLSVTY